MNKVKEERYQVNLAIKERKHELIYHKNGNRDSFWWRTGFLKDDEDNKDGENLRYNLSLLRANQALLKKEQMKLL